MANSVCLDCNQQFNSGEVHNCQAIKREFEKHLANSPEEEIGEVYGFRMSKGYLEEFERNEWHATTPERFFEVVKERNL